MEKSLKYSGLIALIAFFIFNLLHQADIFLLTPLVPIIMDEFKLSYTQVGLIETLTLTLAVIFFPIWGLLCDKYSRAKLVALASFIWGSTTWLTTISKNFFQLLFTRSLTGIDNSVTSGIYSLISDYYPPKRRSLAYGIIDSATPIGTIVGTLIGAYMGFTFGWRTAFTITAIPGILLAFIIWFFVKEVSRGRSEPEFAHIETITPYTINKELAINLLKRKSLLLLNIQGFFGVFPWAILAFWIFTYMVQYRNFSTEIASFIMVIWLIAMTFGNIIAGILGDYLFKRTSRGRVILGAIVVYLSALFIFLTFITPSNAFLEFLLLGAITSFIMPGAGPNVTATIQDTTEPEGRSTALAILRVFENSGSAFAPLIVGILADIYNLHIAILSICVITWVICGVFFTILAFWITKDIKKLRNIMAERAKMEESKMKI